MSLAEGRSRSSLSSIDVLDKLLEILFRRQLDASRSTDRHAAIAEIGIDRGKPMAYLLSGQAAATNGRP